MSTDGNVIGRHDLYPRCELRRERNVTENRNDDDDGGRGHPGTPEGYFGWPEGNAAVQFLDPETGRQLTREEWDAIIAREVEEAKRAGKSLRSPIIVITDPD
jgi:hypothetical protein